MKKFLLTTILMSVLLCWTVLDSLAQETRQNIMPSYTLTGNTFTFEEIGTLQDKVIIPRDLDFHPNGELWVVNQGSESSGGTTVTFYNPGESNQKSLYRKDGNAWHFMSLPSGIVFSENGNFATSLSVFDANHNGGQPFTGPSLWDSDSLVYAQPSGGNGSHIDMLHESPHSMGIAHEQNNEFWIFDAHNNDIVWYDFAEDHGPGNDDHDDGRVRRYPEVKVKWIKQSLSCHLKRDKTSDWLYIVDGGNKRVLRMDVTTGTKSGTPSFGPFETLAEYSKMTNVTWEVVVDTGLVEPVGIDVIANRMIVSNYSNGDIIIYDISSVPAKELGRVQTGVLGIQGVVIGPEGRIWYVNTTKNKVIKIEPSQVVLSDNMTTEMKPAYNLYPNPTGGRLHIDLPGSGKVHVTITDMIGNRVLHREVDHNGTLEFDIGDFRSGMYIVTIDNGKAVRSKKIVVN